MRRYIVALIYLIVLFGFNTNIFANDYQPSVYILPQGVMSGNSVANIQQDFFGGEEIQLPFLVNFAKGVEPKIFVATTQLTKVLGIPYDLQANIITPESESPRVLSLKLPQVARETEFALQFQLQENKSDSFIDAGKIIIRVFPKDMMESIVAWSKRVQLRVHGSQEDLDFFKSHNIQFESDSSPKALVDKMPTITIWIDEDNSRPDLPKDLHRKDAVILFKKTEGIFPSVRIEPLQEGRMITADIAFWVGMNSNPVKQKWFKEILENAISE